MDLNSDHKNSKIGAENNKTKQTDQTEMNNSEHCNKNVKTSTKEILDQGCRTRQSKKTCLENFAQQKSHKNKVKLQNNSKTLPTNNEIIAPKAGHSGVKRKPDEDDEDEDRAKRQRQKFQPFQSPNCQTSTLIQNSGKSIQSIKNKDKMIIYNVGDFLAVRNELDGFYICRAKQNICKNGKKIKIQWYNNDNNPEAFTSDFLDRIDFESILTNLRMDRLDKGDVSLPPTERQRITNILERTIDVEQGNSAPPDPTKVLSDGLDISIIGEIEEDEILRKIKFDIDDNKKGTNGKQKNKNIVNGTLTKENNEQIKETEGQVIRIKKEIKKDIKLNNKIIEKEKFEIINPPHPRQRKTSPTVASNDDIVSSGKEITAIKFDDNSKSSIDDQSEEKDSFFDSRVELPFISTYVNSKLLIRAVLLNDGNLMQDILQPNFQQICSVCVHRSVCINKNAIHYAIFNEDFILLNRLMNVKPQDLTDYPNCIPSMELHHSELSLDKNIYQNKLKIPLLDGSYAKFSMKNNISLDFISKSRSYFQNGLKDFMTNIIVSIKSGNCSVAYFIAQHLCKAGLPGFNKSHMLLLGTDFNLELEYDALNDYTIPGHKVYPIQIAAINPDSYFFSSIINNSLDQLYSSDIDGWMPIHYASVCSTFFNLQYLLNLGVSTLNFDLKGNTPLHLATSYNRLDNVALILNNELAHSSSSVSLKSYNQKGWTPLHIACKKGFVDIIKFFIENSADIDIPTSNNSGELTSLMIASQFGHLNVVKLLIENGANINLYDKKNRGPLTHAVMNGHSNILNSLLNYSANPSKDMFGNNLFHYALAYGWYFCYELILKTNVNMKDTNIFGLTPIYAAFMKGHIGLIEDILKRNILGVNVPVNDSGITLAMLTFSLYPDQNLINYLKLFVEKFKCDLCKTDYNGNNALHYLLQCESKYKLANSQSINQILNEALTILLKNCCDPFITNHAGMSPILFSMKNNCFVAFKHFFEDHHKAARFHQILSGSVHFLPLINFHLLDSVDPDSELVFAKYFVNVYNQNKSIQNIAKNLNLKSNKHGDIPIQHLIKSSRQIISNSSLAQEIAEHEIVEYLDFLLHFYELKFLQDISLLHLAAQFGHSAVVNHLASKFFKIDDLDEMGNTPLAIALKNDNILAAEILLESGANINSKIENDLSSFLYHLSTDKPDFHFVLFLSKFDFNVYETDLNKNSALHLVCKKANEKFAFEIIQVLIEKGIDINAQNKFGETALQVAFKSNDPSEQLCNIFEVLLQNRLNLYLKDSKGFTALNYLFMSNKVNHHLVRIVQTIDIKKYDLNSFVDNNGANLLHYAIKAGDVNSVSYLRSFIDVNRLDSKGNSPLALAAVNNKKDCALVLLRANVELFRNNEYVSDQGDKINVFNQMANNEWTDVLLEVTQKAKRANRVLDFIHILIKSNCINFTTLVYKSLTNSVNLDRNNFKKILLEFSLFTVNDPKNPIQANFLKHFNFELIKEFFVEIFQNSIRNWNYIVCHEILRMFNISQIVQTMQQEKKGRNMISLVFWRLFKEDHLISQMKELVLLFLHQDISINCHAYYPIIENGQMNTRYSYCMDKSELSSLVQYSPLIVAVIKRDYKLVKWLLSLKHKDKFSVDVNFADSNQRTPLMHSILNNDLKMIKLLLDRNYCLEDDNDCWNSDNVTLKNANEVDLLVRDKNRFTLFHYLILPFDYFNYSAADYIFSVLWQLLDLNFKTADFINELYKLAIDNHVLNIASFLEKIEQKKVSIRPNAKKIISNKKIRFNFQNDYDTLLNQFFRTQKSSSISNRNILQDEQTNFPYDVTFTKLDSQKGNYIYNFYKIQIILISDKHVLINRWGRVGTAGNLRKTFFSSKQEAIEEFKRIFNLKSGNAWTSVNDSNVNSVPIQDKYRMVDTKRNMKVVGLSFDLHLDHLVSIKSELSIDLRDLIIRLIKLQAKSVDSVRITKYNNLNSILLDNCDGILKKIYSLIIKQKMPLNRHRKCPLKYMNEIIDLTEEFYNQIGIYGREFDQLSPIMTLTEFFEKSKNLHQLKFTIFAKELLYCAQKTKELNPVDYIYDSFSYELENVLTESEEWKFVYLFLKNSIDFKFNVGTFYRITISDNHDLGPNSYLLWYQLDSGSIFRTFAKGLQLIPITDPNSHFIFQGITLTNQIRNDNQEDDKLSYVLLCEAKLNNILEIGANDAIDSSLLEDKNAIVKSNTTNKDYIQHYLSWKGFTVPFRHSKYNGPTEFTMLDSKYVIPRYLIEFKYN